MALNFDMLGLKAANRRIATSGFGNIAIRPFRITWVVLFLALISASRCYSADVVFISSTRGSSAQQEQLDLATKFYGLNFKFIVASPGNDPVAIDELIQRDETVGVVIAANALADVNRDALLHALHHRRKGSVPVLILGVAADVDPVLLKTWSGGTAFGCRRLGSSLRLQYMFGRVDGLTWQLGNLETPLSISDGYYLVIDENKAVQRISSVRYDLQVFPVFIETTVQQQKIFIASAVSSDEPLMDGESVIGAFLRIAPAMVFIRYCAGERGWHVPHQYANFTIDDPWLRQPYGYVDFQGLLEEMERHDFHTTIAFIPWNFDRSQPGVVSLFRNNPERFSITIHGDNHDHKEFTDYRNKPLAVQIAALKQSVARMERFQTLTGIPYDRVMVFPHSIAPERTLEALKTYNYLATINSTNVPQDAIKPSARSFDLRSVTLAFAGFPSISRYSAAAPISKEYIGINEFLGNPLLFYAHSDYFARGISAFDGVADEVNKLEPDTEWRSLGDIVRHLYLLKQRDDSNYDVLALSSSVCLDNVSGRDSTFFLQKQEIGRQTIGSVIADGLQYPYRMQNGVLNLSITVPKGESRCVAIQYENDLELTSVGTSKDSSVDYFLRIGSDFRDIYLSRRSLGRAVIRSYNELEEKPALGLGCVLIFIGICICAGYRWRVRVRRTRRPLNETRKSSPASQTAGERLESPPSESNDSTH